jgi:multidrug efflux pump subunit AcrB
LAVTVVTVTVWGVVSLMTLPRQEDPRIAWRLANVVTRLPGAAPTRVESLITDVLEHTVKEVDEVEHIYSVSRSGVSLVQVELGDDVTDVGPVWQKVRHKLSEASSRLPEGTIGPVLNDEIMGTFAAVIALTGESSTYRQLKDHAEDLEDQLRFLPTTASTELFGVQQEVIEVELDQAKLAAYDLSFNQVAAVLKSRNVRRPSGRLRVGENELLVEASGEFESQSQLAEMVLLVTDAGHTLHLGDVATIHRTSNTPPEPLARFDGEPAVMVGARARSDVRMDAYGTEVANVVDRFRGTLPANVEVQVLHDMSQYTRQLTSELSRTLLLSVTFVFLSTALFMGWRASGIITAAIPLTGLVVLAIFSALGIPLNQMSVMGMIMAMGMVVDCAIIVTEQIHHRWSEGASIRQAAAEEPGGLFVPLLVSTLTTIAAFIPIYLLPGGTGEFLRSIPLSVGICLLTSLVIAMTVVPWLCCLLMRDPTGAAEGDRHHVSLMSRLTTVPVRWYRVFLSRSIRRPVFPILLVLLVMAGLLSLGTRLRRDFFSPVERDQFIVDVFTPQGSALAHTAELIQPIEAMLLESDDITSVGTSVGRNAPLVFYNLWVQETYANHFSQLIVRVRDWHATAEIAQRVQRQLDTEVTGAQCVVHILEHGAPFVAPFEVRIHGPSVETLEELGRRAGDLLAASPGVRSVRNNYGNEALQLVAQVNEPVARSIGIDQGIVADELRNRLDGLPASYMQEGDERIDINVRLAGTQRDDIADLNAVYFKPTTATRLIPFSSVATLVPEWETASIYRRDGERTLSILAYPEFGLTAAQVSKGFEPVLDALAATLPAGYTLELGGENEQRHEAESNLLKKAVYTACLFILLLVAEFHSFRLACLILVILPLSLGGSMAALWLTGWPLNFMAIMGMMMLIGVMVNDSVVLVDGFEKRRLAGEPLYELILNGTMERGRHIVVTSVTTAAGFLPLAMTKSLLWPPLAIAIIGGLTFSTLLTLIVLPGAYALLRRSHQPAAAIA